MLGKSLHIMRHNMTRLLSTKSAAALNNTASQHPLPVSRGKTGAFLQDPPTLGNQFIEDVTVQKYLKRHISVESYSLMQNDLERFGGRCGGELAELGRQCETNPPTLRSYDAWGRRIDAIDTCPAWKYMKQVSAEEGLIASAYEGQYNQYSRLYQVVKLYLFTPSSGLYSCPLAMTDGAAKTFWAEARKSEGSFDSATNAQIQQAFHSLTSRDPETFWTSGQWMTEKAGGSDVGAGTATVAIPAEDETYSLYGYKWFTSATDSDMALTLARDTDSSGHPLDSTSGRGLSMFFLKVCNEDGSLNNMEIPRLKDKLGTRQLPTAELLLDGSKAYKVSETGKGVASISTMLQITRLHNLIASAAGMRRMVNLARDYSRKRTAFGKKIETFPLHIKALTWMEVETRAATLLMLDMGRMLGEEEGGVGNEETSLLFRLLSPVGKLYTAKQAVAVVSEGLECFGGAGYLEDSGLPSMLRDAQVLPIWEGTTSVLSMDVLRAIYRTNGTCLSALHTRVTGRLSDLPAELKQSGEKVAQAAQELLTFVAENTEILEAAARDLAFSICHIYIGMLLVEHAKYTGDSTDVFTANRWCQRDLLPVITKHRHGNYNTQARGIERQLVFEGYPSKL